MRDYAAIATQYARLVADEDRADQIVACKWVKLACQRHLNDLARDAAGWRYTWNPELETREGKKYRPADRICHFVELLPHIKGDWAARRERIRLEAWQVFVLASIFGWRDRETGRRRFRVADLFVPRKNAKSTLAAGIGLYMLAADDEFGAEVYSGATSEDQAREVFNPAKLMAEGTPEFVQRYGVVPRASNISIPETNSRFEPIIGKPGDGASPSCAIVDEFHEHPTETLYDTMRTGMGARSHPLMLVITTSGDDVAGPCYAHQEELQQVLDGVIEDEQRFGIIFTIDDGDDWTSEEALVKANPNYGVSLDPDFLLAQQRDAVRDPRKQPTFQTKHLNIWVQSSSPWLNVHGWKQLGDRSLKVEDFAGERCYVGLDLSNTTDITSRCRVFRRRVDGADHFYAFWRHYLPETRIDEPDNRHYQGWWRDGWLVKTEGGMIDQQLILEDLRADRRKTPITELALDLWGAPGIAADLQKDGIPVTTVPMTAQHLSAPMKFIDGLVEDGRIHHCGDPVAMWGVSNVQVKPDRNENWFPRRGSRGKKIDPAIALIVAIARAMRGTGRATIDDWLATPA